MNRLRSCALVGLAALLAIIGNSAISTAQHVATPSASKSARPPPVAAKCRPSTNRAGSRRLARWIMPYALASNDIAGAAVVVVRGGEIDYAARLGLCRRRRSPAGRSGANRLSHGIGGQAIHLDGCHAACRAGSARSGCGHQPLSRLPHPASGGRPITMRNLMTHTPGFEEHVKNLVTSEGAPLPLRDYVRRWTPERIYPPGRTIAYSNYGVTLAGYIVERVSARPTTLISSVMYSKPLGMSRSTSRQPLPPALQRDAGKGYCSDQVRPCRSNCSRSVPPAGTRRLSRTWVASCAPISGGGRLGEKSVLQAGNG